MDTIIGIVIVGFAGYIVYKMLTKKETVEEAVKETLAEAKTEVKAEATKVAEVAKAEVTKIADVNGDGKVDLSITDSRSHFVEILQYRPDSGLKHALYFRIFEQKSFRNEDEGGGTDPRGLRRLCVHL